MHLASFRRRGPFLADYTFMLADAGVHAFPITLTTVGDRSITVTDTADATRTATQSAITVVNGPGATITLTGSTAALEVGESRVLTATVRDAYGNVVQDRPRRDRNGEDVRQDRRFRFGRAPDRWPSSLAWRPRP